MTKHGNTDLNRVIWKPSNMERFQLLSHPLEFPSVTIKQLKTF